MKRRDPSVIKKKLKVQHDRERVKTDLFYLCKEYLGFNLMTPEFHGEMCAFLEKHSKHKDVAIFTPRESYKTTLMVGYVIQSLLKNPNEEIFYIHHRLSDAIGIGRLAGEQILQNDKLRALFPPQHLPDKKSKQWLNADGFTLKGRKVGVKHKSFTPCSLGQNITGSHPSLVILDDVVNYESVEESGGVDKIREWFGHTLTSVLGAAGATRLVGTVWSDDDPHADVINDPHWKVFKRSICEDPETHEPLLPEDGGTPIPILVDRENPRPLTLTDIARYRRRAKGHFYSQYMMIPNKDRTYIWFTDSHDHEIDQIAVSEYLRSTVVLMDPAPKEMSEEGASGDDWSIAVVGYANVPPKLRHGDEALDVLVPEELRDQRIFEAGLPLVRVLLDGRVSNEWTVDQGVRRALYLAHQWNARVIGVEEFIQSSADLYCKRIREMARSMGIRVDAVRLKSTKHGKRARFIELAAMAEVGDFRVCKETCNKSFLAKFDSQVHGYCGPNSLKHDDVYDSVSYCNDPALEDYIPKAMRKKIRVETPVAHSSRFRYINA